MAQPDYGQKFLEEVAIYDLQVNNKDKRVPRDDWPVILQTETGPTMGKFDAKGELMRIVFDRTKIYPCIQVELSTKNTKEETIRASLSVNPGAFLSAMYEDITLENVNTLLKPEAAAIVTKELTKKKKVRGLEMPSPFTFGLFTLVHLTELEHRHAYFLDAPGCKQFRYLDNFANYSSTHNELTFVIRSGSDRAPKYALEVIRDTLNSYAPRRHKGKMIRPSPFDPYYPPELRRDHLAQLGKYLVPDKRPKVPNDVKIPAWPTFVDQTHWATTHAYGELYEREHLREVLSKLKDDPVPTRVIQIPSVEGEYYFSLELPQGHRLTPGDAVRITLPPIRRGGRITHEAETWSGNVEYPLPNTILDDTIVTVRRPWITKAPKTRPAPPDVEEVDVSDRSDSEESQHEVSEPEELYEAEKRFMPGQFPESPEVAPIETEEIASVEPLEVDSVKSSSEAPSKAASVASDTDPVESTSKAPSEASEVTPTKAPSAVEAASSKNPSKASSTTSDEDSLGDPDVYPGRWSEYPLEHVLYTGSLRTDEIRAKLVRSPAMLTRVELVDSDKHFARQISSLFQLRLAAKGTKSQAASPQAKQVLTHICGSDINSLNETNAFGAICENRRTDFLPRLKATIAKDKTLLEDQSDAILGMFKFKGFFYFIHGPPGTGKTYVIAYICMLMARWGRIDSEGNQKKAPVLVVAPSNETADHLTKVIQERLLKECPGSVVARMYASTTEVKLIKTHLTNRPRPANARPKAFPDDIDPTKAAEALKSMNELGSHLVERTKDRHTQKFPGVWDKRVKLPDASIATLMRAQAGIPGFDHPAIPVSYEQEAVDFKDRYERWDGGEYMEGETKKQFTAVNNKMRDYSLKSCNVVVCTPAQAADQKLYGAFDPDLIIVDECVRLRDTELIMAVANYLTARACVLVGDHFQIKTMVRSTPEINPFVGVLKNPAFQRLILGGCNSAKLINCWRLPPLACQLVSVGFYNETLVSAPDMKLPPEMARMAAINKYYWHINSAIMAHDMKAATEERDENFSAFSNVIIAMCTNKVKIMIDNDIPGRDIFILTPYSAESAHVRNALHRMAIISPSLARQVSQIEVNHIDPAQGRENLHILLLIPNTEKPGFLTESGRLCVALTRMRASLTIFVNWHVLKNHYQKMQGFGTVMESLKSRGFIDVEHKIIPSVYHPKQDRLMTRTQAVQQARDLVKHRKRITFATAWKFDLEFEAFPEEAPPRKEVKVPEMPQEYQPITSPQDPLLETGLMNALDLNFESLLGSAKKDFAYQVHDMETDLVAKKLKALGMEPCETEVTKEALVEAALVTAKTKEATKDSEATKALLSGKTTMDPTYLAAAIADSTFAYGYLISRAQATEVDVPDEIPFEYEYPEVIDIKETRFDEEGFPIEPSSRASSEQGWTDTGPVNPVVAEDTKWIPPSNFQAGLYNYDAGLPGATWDDGAKSSHRIPDPGEAGPSDLGHGPSEALGGDIGGWVDEPVRRSRPGDAEDWLEDVDSPPLSDNEEDPKGKEEEPPKSKGKGKGKARQSDYQDETGW